MRVLSNAVKAAIVPKDGVFSGLQSGYCVKWSAELSPGLTQEYEFTDKVGYRGLNIPVNVTVTGGVVTKVELVR